MTSTGLKLTDHSPGGLKPTIPEGRPYSNLSGATPSAEERFARLKEARQLGVKESASTMVIAAIDGTNGLPNMGGAFQTGPGELDREYRYQTATGPRTTAAQPGFEQHLESSESTTLLGYEDDEFNKSTCESIGDTCAVM